jgi:hypothetical protein
MIARSVIFPAEELVLCVGAFCDVFVHIAMFCWFVVSFASLCWKFMGVASIQAHLPAGRGRRL